jgi:hypothetical protein
MRVYFIRICMYTYVTLGSRYNMLHVTVSRAWGKRENVSHFTVSDAWWGKEEKVSHITVT